MGGIVGRRMMSGDTVNTTMREGGVRRVFAVQNVDIKDAIADGKLTPDEIRQLGAQELAAENLERATFTATDASTRSDTFKSGIISFLPMGTVASTIHKSSYGMELTGSDYFWSAVDAAFTTATLGAMVWAKSGMQIAGKATLKEGLKQYTFQPGVTGRVKAVLNVAGKKNRFALDGIVKPVQALHNGKWAGKILPASEFKNLGLSAKELVAVKRLCPQGIPFSSAGYPNFSQFASKIVNVGKLTGNNRLDMALFNKIAGFKKTPLGYVWHHAEDGMRGLLIPKDLHRAISHSGGASLLRGQKILVDGMIQTTKEAARTVLPGSLIGGSALLGAAINSKEQGKS